MRLRGARQALRPRDWQEAGVWRKLHRVLLDRLGEADRIDRERAPPRKGRRANLPESDG